MALVCKTFWSLSFGFNLNGLFGAKHLRCSQMLLNHTEGRLCFPSTFFKQIREGLKRLGMLKGTSIKILARNFDMEKKFSLA